MQGEYGKPGLPGQQGPNGEPGLPGQKCNQLSFYLKFLETKLLPYFLKAPNGLQGFPGLKGPKGYL